jgi:hypothetical protein
MRNTHATALALAGALAAALPGCALDVGDLNNPSLDDLQNHPTVVTIGAASTGLLVGNRRNHAAENGYVNLLGILGRESYNFDVADPRYVSEMLQKKLNPGNGPFGGNFWSGPYNNIRLAVVVLEAVDKVELLSDAEKSAIRGFTKTIEALDLLEVVATHDTNGAVIDLDPDPLAPPTPLVSAPDTYARIATLLDAGVADLNAGGDSFPFALSKGFGGFDTPATFIKFNRAIRARAAAYTGDYPATLAALAGSFIDDTSANINLNVGVTYVYSNKPGDTANQLINVNIYAHPSIATDVQMNAMTGLVDARLTNKTAVAKNPGQRGATLNFHPLYPDSESPVSLIRNEELILLKAEALFATGQVADAVAHLNIVRTIAGRLPALTNPTPTMDEFITELLYEREFSLLFEGHRWIDVRRLGRISTLPIFVTTKTDGTMVPDVLNVRFPIPLVECDARPGEPRCLLGSTDPAP